MFGVQTQNISAFPFGDHGQHLKPTLAPTVSAASCSKVVHLCYELCETQDHWVIQAGRDLKMAVVQPPAQCRVTYEVRLGCSGLYPARRWKPPRVETAQPPCSNIFSVSSEKYFPLYPVISDIQLFMAIVLCLPAMHCQEDPGSSFSVRQGYCLIGAS